MKIAKEISIRKKISQLLIPRLEGNHLTNPVYFKKIKRLVKQGIGGFILFGGKKEYIKNAIEKLQEASEIPLFIASDLEQGLGQQVDGGTVFPNAMAIGSAIDPDNRNDIKLLRQAISIIAIEAYETGINVILAPVLDINTNPQNPIICTRAFSEDAKEVSWFGKQFIKGVQKMPGLIACGKHFPGHGDTETDSHIEIPVIRSSLKRLDKIELYPFIEAIRSGVKMIMVGHLLVDALDSDKPASLSPRVINKLLRNKLKFNGLVITDAMNMGAIKKIYSENEACLMAIKAGADIILHPVNPESVIEYLSSRWKEIEKKVEESLKRILKAKEKLGSNPPLPPFSKGGKIGGLRLPISIEARNEVAEKLTDKAIRVLKGIPEFSKNSFLLSIDDDSSGAGKDFIEALKLKFQGSEAIDINSKNINTKREMAFKKIKGRSVIIGIFSDISAWKGRSGISPALLEFLKNVLSKSDKSTVISFGCPYILDDLEADTLIAAYWNSDLSRKAVGKLLCGETS